MTIHAEQKIVVPNQLFGLYCRELEEDANLVEIAAKGTCKNCGVEGFFNHARIQRPFGLPLKTCADLQLGGITIHPSDLSPKLVAGGPEPEGKLCPTCYLAWFDPTNFPLKEHEHDTGI